MKICPYCGSSVSDIAKFCPECGTRLSERDREEEYAQQDFEEGLPEQDFEERLAEQGFEEGLSEQDFEEEFSQRDREEEEFASQNRKTMMIGIIMAVLICVVGIGLYIVVSNMLKQEAEIEVGSGLGSKPVQIETTPVPGEVPEEDISEGIPSVEEEEPEEITATVLESGQVQISGYTQAAFAGCQESSVLEDYGVYHVSQHMIDGRPETSWQEAADGDGIGEWVLFQLDREYSVRYLTFMSGNWKSEELFYANNRPQDVLLKLDDQEFYLTFPDGMKEYTVELSEDCQASGIFLQVLSVYGGASWDDCCISEMSVYGR